MKYKNIVFDFGNVIGKFDGKYIMEQFCSSQEDCRLLMSVLFKNWSELDKGTIDYEENISACAALVPERLRDTVYRFFHEWPEHIVLIQETLDFIGELKQRGIPVYLLSNAPTFFAEWAGRYPFLRDFDGVVFSAPLKMAKPGPEIYRYLFRTYSVLPEECFFIDDLEANIRTGRELGMNGIVFTGNIDEVKAAICF